MIKKEPWVGGTDEEYETQHFGFGAQRLRISVREMVEQKIKTGVKDMESYLQKALDLNDTDKSTLTHACDKLVRLYCERAGPSLGVIDEEIRKLVNIPSNVLLPENEVQLEQISDEDCEKLRDEVNALRKNVERCALMESLLMAEEEELASLEPVCDKAKKDMEILDLLHKKAEENDYVKVILSETQLLCQSTPFMNNDNNSMLI